MALTKFGKKRGILATTGRLSPQLKREFTDNFPHLDLDWLDGADIVDEVFSNPLLFRAWVARDTIGRETTYVRVPFVVRRASDDTPVELMNAELGDGLTVDGRAVIDVGSLERFRPPESVHWSESFGRYVSGAALLSVFPPDLHALETLHRLVLDKLFPAAGDVLTIRFGIPYLVPTKTPTFERGMPIPGFLPRSYVVRPGKEPMPEQEFLLLALPEWRWPEYLSVAEGDWGNWQSADNQRWCHIEVQTPSFPNSTQSHICRMIGDSTRRELREAGAIFLTATSDVCDGILGSCTVEPDVQCANGPGGELLGWFFRDRTERDAHRREVLTTVAREYECELVSIEDAVHVTSRSDEPLVPSPRGEVYYPAQLVWDYAELSSPHYLMGRRCTFVEFWSAPSDLATARAELARMSFTLPDSWTIYFDCKMGSNTKRVFPMLSVGVPWPLSWSTTELVEDVGPKVDEVFAGIAAAIQSVWPNAYRATSEFWESEVRFPAGAYVATDKGLVRTSWRPEVEEEGDD